jgi:lysozyme family protein
MSVEEMISGILRREGWPKFTDHAADRGGPTKGGITLASWRDYKRDAQLTVEDLRTVTEAQAREFYYARHVAQPHFDLVADVFLRELLIDAGVNHGPGNPIRWVQAAAHVEADGVLGPMSIAAINGANPLELVLWVCISRINFFGELTTRDPQLKLAREAGFELQAQFTAGWLSRATEFLGGAARRLAQAQRQTP